LSINGAPSTKLYLNQVSALGTLKTLTLEGRSGRPWRVDVMDQLVFVAIGGISTLLAINSWLLWHGVRVLNDEVKLMRETLQLEIHAIRDLMEETERRHKQRDASQ
tara:strand:+ start:349 stop:666 length:318 start_codon:yes stop_codon:yes gene_type:complete